MQIYFTNIEQEATSTSLTGNGPAYILETRDHHDGFVLKLKKKNTHTHTAITDLDSTREI